MYNNSNEAQEVVSQGISLKSTLVSHNITVNGHRTSARLEPEMLIAFKECDQLYIAE